MCYKKDEVLVCLRLYYRVLMVVIKDGILKVRFGLYIIIIEGLIMVVIKFS